MHFPSITSVSLAAVCLLGVCVRPVRSEDAQKVSAEVAGIQRTPDTAIERGLVFLERDAAKWRNERGCATCHHGTMTVWALSEAKAQGYSVAADVLAEMMQWTKDRFVPPSSGPQASQPGSASIPLLYLGTMSQNLPILSRDEISRIAAHLAARQGEDGAWELPPPKNGPPPTWESRETVALLALIAWEPSISHDDKEAAAARASRDKTVTWLSTTKSTDTTQALTLRLLLHARRAAPAEQLQAGIEGLLKRQLADGGWSQTNDRPGDAYATGQALYALSLAGVKSDRPEIQRAVAFLAATQGDDGSWPMISRGHPGVEPFTNPVPITYFGSAWAMLGLVRFVPSPPDAPQKQRSAFDNILAFHGKYEVDETIAGRPVTVVDLRYYEVSDKEVGDFTERLQAFPRLTTLQFKSTKITDAGLTHLKRLPRLRTLVLENARITDTGVGHLKDLIHLEALNLKGTQVTDAGVQRLQEALPSVKVER
jgi:squalene-hopene/tetraprenyl-beta-curcumene cyclase